MAYPKTPSLDRVKALAREVMVVQQFMDWISMAKCVTNRRKTRVSDLAPRQTVEEFWEVKYGIKATDMEDEKRAILEHLQELNSAD